ncbi:MAG: DNA polymerase III subunit chi [Hyphomicrobiaceae bacterium]
MTEVLFYHLQGQPLERVLPNLLEKTLARGWRAVIRSGSLERLEALDAALWTYSDPSFLPHGTKKDGYAEHQPIYLTTTGDNPNGAAVRFLVDGAQGEDLSGYERIVYLFDGNDSAAVAEARAAWIAAKAQNWDVTYWQQSQGGRWEKKR